MHNITTTKILFHGKHVLGTRFAQRIVTNMVLQRNTTHTTLLQFFIHNYTYILLYAIRVCTTGLSLVLLNHLSDRSLNGLCESKGIHECNIRQVCIDVRCIPYNMHLTVLCFVMLLWCYNVQWSHVIHLSIFSGLLSLRMADRALLAGYPRYESGRCLQWHNGDDQFVGLMGLHQSWDYCDCVRYIFLHKPCTPLE